jgi:hypothetical protein
MPTAKNVEDTAKASGEVYDADLGLEELFKDFIRGQRVTP